MKILCQKFSPPPHPPSPPPSACFSSDKLLSALYLSLTSLGSRQINCTIRHSSLSLISFPRFWHVPCTPTPITLPILPAASSDFCTQVICNRSLDKKKKITRMRVDFDWPVALRQNTFIPLKFHKHTSSYRVRLQGTSAQGERRCGKKTESGRKEGGIGCKCNVPS